MQKFRQRRVTERIIRLSFFGFEEFTLKRSTQASVKLMKNEEHSQRLQHDDI